MLITESRPFYFFLSCIFRWDVTVFFPSKLIKCEITVLSGRDEEKNIKKVAN